MKIKHSNKIFGFQYAFKGIAKALKTERNFKIQCLVFMGVVCMGFLLKINSNDWIHLLLISGLVLSLELINSAIEGVCNLISESYHPKIEKIKDISAGAVLIASLCSIVIGLLIFLPHLMAKISF